MICLTTLNRLGKIKNDNSSIREDGDGKWVCKKARVCQNWETDKIITKWLRSSWLSDACSRVTHECCNRFAVGKIISSKKLVIRLKGRPKTMCSFELSWPCGWSNKIHVKTVDDENMEIFAAVDEIWFALQGCGDSWHGGG